MIETPTLPYTIEQSEAARREWKAACGHHSIAAACNVSLDAVKAACPKLCGWMNPTMIGQTLEALGVKNERGCTPFRMDPPPWRITAIMRIQFEGPWMRNVKSAYKHTHYIAVRGGMVLDVMNEPYAFIPWVLWEAEEDMTLMDQKPEATGWHFTDGWVFED